MKLSWLESTETSVEEREREIWSAVEVQRSSWENSIQVLISSELHNGYSDSNRWGTIEHETEISTPYRSKPPQQSYVRDNQDANKMKRVAGLQDLSIQKSRKSTILWDSRYDWVMDVLNWTI